jgi:hypothetical protein
MKVNENGDYQLNDGTLIPKEQVTKQYLMKEPASVSEDSPKSDKLVLEEGQCSGKILLQD